MTRVLVIEDNANLRRGLRDLLEQDGFEVLDAPSAKEGLRQVREDAPDLVLLDLMLPDFAGERVLRTVREHEPYLPILVVTAKHQEDDKVRALQLGADDYVTKPFGRKELSARVAALLRRSRRAAGASPEPDALPAAPSSEWMLSFGDVVVDVRAHVVTRGDTPVSLSPKEFELLVALLRRAGAVVTRRQLLEEVWGYRSGVRSRTIDLHMLELRRRLEPDPSRPRYLLTVRKVGYRFAPDG